MNETDGVCIVDCVGLVTYSLTSVPVPRLALARVLPVFLLARESRTRAKNFSLLYHDEQKKSAALGARVESMLAGKSHACLQALPETLRTYMHVHVALQRKL